MTAMPAPRAQPHPSSRASLLFVPRPRCRGVAPPVHGLPGKFWDSRRGDLNVARVREDLDAELRELGNEEVESNGNNERDVSCQGSASAWKISGGRKALR